MANLKGVEIFGTGTWNRMKFVDDDLREITTNTNKLLAKQRIPLKLGHSAKQILAGQTDGDPALGYAQNFMVKDNKITADFENMPDILFESIEKARFTSVSIEMTHEANFGWYITAIALLGADIPAVKSISDLQAYLTEIIPAMTASQPQQVLTFSEPKMQNMRDTKMEDQDNIARENAELREQIKRFRADTIQRNFADQKESILAGYREDSKAGKLPPAMLAEVERHLDSQAAQFTEIATLHLSADLARKVAVAYTEAIDKRETASDAQAKPGATPDVMLSQAVAQSRAQTGMGYKDALDLVIAGNPQLFADYHRWTADIAEGRA